MKEKTVAGTAVSALDGNYMLSSCGCIKSIHLLHILFGVVITIAGVILVLLPEEGIITNKDFTSAVSMAGLLIGLYGLYYVLFRNRRMVSQATGSPVKHYQNYYEPAELQQLKDFIQGTGTTLPVSRQQGGVYLNAYIADDYSVACVQLSQYQDLAYEPVTEPTKLSAEKTQILILNS